MNQLADVSIGDTPDQPKNNSFIISRSETGDELLKAAKNAHYINCTTEEPTSLKNGILPFMIKEKRLKVSYVLAHLSRKNIPVPDWGIIPGPIAQADRINAILRIELVRFIRTKLIADFLKSHPRLMESIGGRVYRLDVDPKRNFYPLVIKFLQSHPKFAAKARAIRNQSLDLPKKLRLISDRHP